MHIPTEAPEPGPVPQYPWQERKAPERYGFEARGRA